MQNMIPFNYNSKQVRVIEKNGEPWFVAKDIAEILEYSNPAKMYARIEEDEKTTIPYREDGSNYQTNIVIINESGLYEAILGSEKPEAKEFKKWVKREVLPSIRKTGGYIANDDLFINTYLPFADDTVKSLFKATLQTVRQQNEKIKALTPKAQSFDHFIDGSNLQTMNDVAKCLGIGRNKLFALLREKKIIRSNNTPYQEYIDRGYFEVKEKPIKMGDASINYAQTYVTAKGVAYISKIVEKSA